MTCRNTSTTATTGSMCSHTTVTHHMPPNVATHSRLPHTFGIHSQPPGRHTSIPATLPRLSTGALCR